MNIHDILGDPAEKPLDHLVTDGGFCGIFRKIGCIGDSLSSGEFEAFDENGVKTYHDMAEYSWGQFLARMAGCTVFNFSRGGMTAKEYYDSFAEENGFWDKEKACQAYIIALGVNDLLNQNMSLEAFGDYYGAILSRLRQISPDARFFFMTMPRSDTETPESIQKKQGHADLLYTMAKNCPNAYVLNFRKYAPVYDDAFRKAFYLGGHMNPCGYLLTAKMVASYVDYIIRHDWDAFREVAFIGTKLRYSHP